MEKWVVLLFPFSLELKLIALNLIVSVTWFRIGERVGS